MKTLLIACCTLFASGSFAQAGIIEAHLPNIQDRVRACTVLPYTVKHGHRVYQNLISHCPEVQLVGKMSARIKVGGTTYQVSLVETIHTDGDLYDVVIREPRSHETYRMRNVLAYGDVFLGVLAGDTRGIRQARLSNAVY